MKPKESIDFIKVEWDKIEREKLDFFFKEAVDYNDILIHDIGNLNNKAFQLLTIAITALSAATGFLLALWGIKGKEQISIALLVACIGLGIVFALLLLSVFPRAVYRGRSTPGIIFSETSTMGPLYKAPLPKIIADGIASYHDYITENNKVMKYRSRFLTAGIIGFFAVPLITVTVFLIIPHCI